MKQKGSDRPKPREGRQPTLLGLPNADPDEDAALAAPRGEGGNDANRTSGASYRPPPPSSFPPPARRPQDDELTRVAPPSEEGSVPGRDANPIPPRPDLSVMLEGALKPGADLADLFDDVDLQEPQTAARALHWDNPEEKPKAAAPPAYDEDNDELEDVPTTMNIDESMLLPSPTTNPALDAKPQEAKPKVQERAPEPKPQRARLPETDQDPQPLVTKKPAAARPRDEWDEPARPQPAVRAAPPRPATSGRPPAPPSLEPPRPAPQRANPTLIGTGGPPGASRPPQPPRSDLAELDRVVAQAKADSGQHALRESRARPSRGDPSLAYHDPELDIPRGLTSSGEVPVPSLAPPTTHPEQPLPRSAAPVVVVAEKKSSSTLIVAGGAFLAGTALAGVMAWWFTRAPAPEVAQAPAPTEQVAPAPQPTAEPPAPVVNSAPPQPVVAPPVEATPTPPPTEVLPDDPRVEADNQAAADVAAQAERQTTPDPVPTPAQTQTQTQTQERQTERQPERTNERTSERANDRGADRAEKAASAAASFDAIREEARVAFQASRWQEAAAAYERAVAANPRHAGSWAGLGAARSQMGDLRGAVAAYNKAIELSPSTSGFHAALGRVLRQANDRDGAVRAYRRALELNPDNGAAAQALEELQ